MITLLSALLGLLGSGFPKIIEFFQDKVDKNHELNIMNLQLEMAKLNVGAQLQEIQTTENIAEIKALYSTWNTGIHWIDALNALIRPVIAIVLIIVYCSMEYSIFIACREQTLSVSEMSEALWTQEDQSFFTCILAYYFGARTLEKFS